jgi:hypothetical protein
LAKDIYNRERGTERREKKTEIMEKIREQRLRHKIGRKRERKCVETWKLFKPVDQLRRGFNCMGPAQMHAQKDLNADERK